MPFVNRFDLIAARSASAGVLCHRAAPVPPATVAEPVNGSVAEEKTDD